MTATLERPTETLEPITPRRRSRRRNVVPNLVGPCSSSSSPRSPCTGWC